MPRLCRRLLTHLLVRFQNLHRFELYGLYWQLGWYRYGFCQKRYSKVEAAREKIKHFLRKFILFFVSLFVILFHFFKSDGDVAFYLPITYNQLTTCFTSFVSTNCIGKRKLGNPEVFK